MSIVHICVQCSDANPEISTNDVQNTELIIENLVSTALLEIFECVQVEDVTVRHSFSFGYAYKPVTITN